MHSPHSLYYPKECPRGSATDWYSLWVLNSASTIIALAPHAFLFPGAIPDDCRAQWHTPDNTYINELSPTWIMTPPRAPHHCPGLLVKEGTGSQARARPSERGYTPRVSAVKLKCIIIPLDCRAIWGSSGSVRRCHWHVCPVNFNYATSEWSWKTSSFSSPDVQGQTTARKLI